MKKLGYLMITFGFLAGSLLAVMGPRIVRYPRFIYRFFHFLGLDSWLDSLLAVLEQCPVRWDLFAGALTVGAVGVAIVRLSNRRESRLEGKLTSNIQSIETSLNRIVENMRRLNAEKQSINTYDMRHRIDELLRADLGTFVDARESIAQVHGLGAYADVMSNFAAGERYLNRVWSASADGYIDEVNAYLDKAHIQFVEALQRLRRLTE
jgi:hypothetical protein